MSTESDLVTGIAELLHTAGVSTWSPTAAYTGPGPVTVIGDAPASPDRTVTLAVYPVQDDPHLADALYGVQVRVRGTRDARTTWDVAAAVRDTLNGRAGFQLGAVHVVECHRHTTAPLGRDESGRWEQADTYYIQISDPTTYRPW